MSPAQGEVFPALAGNPFWLTLFSESYFSVCVTISYPEAFQKSKMITLMPVLLFQHLHLWDEHHKNNAAK